MEPKLYLSAPLSEAETEAWTTPEERAEALRFGAQNRRREYLSWRAMVRRALGAEVKIAYNEVGAPYLMGRKEQVSVAHCKGQVAALLSEGACGVDIEAMERDFSRAEGRFLSPEERALSQNPLLAGVVWCAKEALYKWAGRKGVDFLRDIRIEAVDFERGELVGRVAESEPIPLRLLLHEGYIVVYTL